MALFVKHRQKALVLALVAAFLTSPMLAGRGFTGSIGGGSPTPDPPGDGKGDPDTPSGPARKIVPGEQRVVAPSRETPIVGDGRVSNYGAWMWRLRIVLKGLRAYTFRF